MANVSLRGITKSYAKGASVISGLDMEIEDGELLVMVGPSGCGKSTLLKVIAGLEDVEAGDILIGGNRVNDLDPSSRDVAMVFQNYALYPNMTVRDNMAFSLRLRRFARAVQDQRVGDAASLLGLDGLLTRRPASMSGGQRQRVAMGRAIVREPAVFLMDEPLSNLDAKLRVKMRADITELQHRLGATMIFVTHDQIEAMTMADRVAVMRSGVLQQVAPPSVLYSQPANLFVAEFIGSPSMNLMSGTLRSTTDGAIELIYSDSEPALHLPAPSVPAEAIKLGSVILGIRPENLSLGTAEHGGQAVRGTVRLVESLGSEVLAHLEMDMPEVVSEDVLAALEDAETSQDSRNRKARFVVRLPGTARPSVGDAAYAVFDHHFLHFFSPIDGERL